MYVFLAKKIAIPKKAVLSCVAWNSDHGWIACGGEGALLKVVRLDAQKSEVPMARGIAAPSSLGLSQNLEGHKTGTVQVAAWNAIHRKLTTSDSTGMIVVWVHHRGKWLEEMINNRSSTVVVDMHWNAEGKEICIAYRDGHVIVGGVKGNRLWGKNLGYELSKVAWSPDCRTLLFVTADSQVHTYTREGMRTGTMRLAGAPEGDPAAAGKLDPINAVDWYDGAEGYEDPSAPSLAFAFSSGRLQLCRSTTDDEPVLLESGLDVRQVVWNCAGTVLAVAGVSQRGRQAGAASGGGGLLPGAGPATGGIPEAGSPSVVQFYTPFGQLIRTLKVPGDVTSLSWEGGGLRIAMAVGYHVYFANVRPDYKWSVFGDTIVYAFAKPDRDEQCLVFWDTESGDRHEKYLKHLLGVHAAPDGDHCLVVTRADDGSAAASMKGGLVSGLGVAGSAAAGQYLLVLFDAIGSPVETRFLRWKPQHIAVTKTHVVASSDSTVYVWQYRSGLDASGAGAGSTSSRVGRTLAEASKSGTEGGDRTSSGGALRLRGMRERYFHIDDVMALDASGKASGGRDASAAAAGGGGLRPAGYETRDPVVSVCANRQCMLVGRSSGVVVRYTLPHLVQDAEFRLRKPASKLALNCDSTVFSVVNIDGFLSFFDTRRHRVDPATGQSVEGEQLAEERKDTWAMRWAEDSPELFASMEKTKMFVYRDCKPGNPVLSSGYLGRFRNLRMQVAMLDDVMAQPDKADVASCVLFHQTKSLQEAQGLIESASPQAAVQYIQENAHPTLWRLLAESALERLDFATAEQAFVGGEDYAGIQLVKRLRRLGHNAKQKAEVHVHFGRFQAAEDAYRAIDRLDLAIEMRAREGDWKQALDLASAGEADGVDRIVAECRRRIGDQLMDQQLWSKAAHELAETDDKAALIKCYRAMDDFDALARLVDDLPEGSPLLLELGRALQSAGVAQPAVEALLKAGQPQQAVDCCVLLNEWDRAIELAQTHDFPQVESLLNKYAVRLLNKGQVIAAVELYRKAGRHAEAAHLLAQLAESSLAARKSPLRAKKLFVLAALEVEQFRQQAADKAVGEAGKEGMMTAATATAAMTATMMDTMLRTDATLSASTVGGERAAKRAARTLDNAWHGAEALHFWMLGQRQLYAREFDAAMATAARLAALYEDVLPPRDVYSLLALASFRAGFFGLASRAFIRLEAVAAGEDDAETEGGGAKAIGGAAGPMGASGGGGVSLATAATTIMGGAETASDLAAALGAIPLPRPATAGLGMAAAQLPTEAAQAMQAGGFGDRATAGVGSAASLALQAEQARRSKQRAREEYEQLAFQLFMRHPPHDPSTRTHPCPHCKEGVQGWQPNCGACGALFSPSVASGLPIRGQPYYRCGRCKHKCLLHEVEALGLTVCPLCHDLIDQEQVEKRQGQVRE